MWEGHEHLCPYWNEDIAAYESGLYDRSKEDELVSEDGEIVSE